MKRISKKDYYLGVAKAIAQRSPCIKMRVGAVLVKDDAIISTGYNGPARGQPHCKKCNRMNKESGSEYSICPAIHAEENAVINAARQGSSTIGSVLYLWTDRSKLKPCYRCLRALTNAGVNRMFINE